MRRLFNWFSHRAQRTNRAILELTCLEGRETPAVGFTATGAAAGAAPVVTVRNPSGATLAQFNAYDPVFLGGVNTAVGEIDGNLNTVEVVTGAGPGGGPHVKVFSVNTLTGAVSTLASFMAYDPAFHGGVNVATGMFGPAGVDDVITGAGPGGGPHVRVFSIGANGAATQVNGTLGSFMAFAPTFTGGVSFGTISPAQLTVNSLTGGGVTQFAIGSGGNLIPIVVTPLTTAGVPSTVSASTQSTIVPGADSILIPTFTSTTTEVGPPTTSTLPFNSFAVGANVVSSPAVTGFPTISAGSPAPNFSDLGFSNLTPEALAAANGSLIPGFNV